MGIDVQLPDTLEHELSPRLQTALLSGFEDIPIRVVQLTASWEASGKLLVSCYSINGDEILSTSANSEGMLISDLRRDVAKHLTVPWWKVQFVLPSGGMLEE